MAPDFEYERMSNLNLLIHFTFMSEESKKKANKEESRAELADKQFW